MTPDEQILAAELALGLLEGDERADALRRVLSDPDFAAETAWWRERTGTMALDQAEEAPPAARTAERRGRTQAAPVPAAVEGEVLFEALRRWRAAEAKAQSVPPYIIFQDSVLREIAEVRPESLDMLGLIRGVGTSKLERYGDAVLEVVARGNG